MATFIADTVLHIDESLEDWQRSVLQDHMRVQDGVIAAGYNDASPNLMIIEYNPEHGHPVKYINMVKRHGYHAQRIA